MKLEKFPLVYQSLIKERDTQKLVEALMSYCNVDTVAIAVGLLRIANALEDLTKDNLHDVDDRR